MSRLVNVTIPVEAEDDEGLGRFMSAMASGMDKLARAAAPHFGVTLLDIVEAEELVSIPTVEPAKREDI